MNMVNWACWVVFVIQQLLMHRSLALNIKQSSMKNMSTDRIVEGNFAWEHQFPWMAAIYRNYFDKIQMKLIPKSYGFHCGGTILNLNIILTAAHCVFEADVHAGLVFYQYQPVDLLVVVGSSEITENFPSTHQVQSILVHSKYAFPANDIALLKLSQPLNFNNRIKAMNLLKEPVFHGQMATVAGWGNTCQPNFIYDGLLRFASVQVVPFENCAYITLPEESALCVGSGLRTSRISQGDSGSGMCIEKNNENYLIGIATISPDCEFRKIMTTSVFMNVSYFYNWIAESVKALSKPNNNNNNGGELYVVDYSNY